MKKLFVILAVLFSSISYSQSGWYQVSNNDSTLIFSNMIFTSENTGYATGYYGNYFQGAILKTTNAGTNWQITQFQLVISDICFLNNNTGFFTAWPPYGNTSHIYKTTNAGLNWILKDSLTSSLFKIKFYDANTGFIAAKYSKIYKTINGGNNWVLQTGVNWAEPSTLNCIDANTWFVGDGGFTINKTTNGGVNWVILNITNIGFECYKLTFINNTTGFSASHQNGRIFRTTNAGDNWTQISAINRFQVWGDIMFMNDNTGYLCGGYDSGGVCKTTNGGYNWSIQRNSPNYINTMYFTNANTGFIANYRGSIFKTINGGVGISQIITEMPSKYSLSQNYPNPFNSTSNLKFQIVNTGDVKLIVYDVMGREVQTLVNESLKPGTYEASFDGSVLNSGVYFYRLSTGDFTESKKMLLIK